jgi:hypothetical protein
MAEGTSTFSTGDRCEANYQGLGIWYSGCVTNVHADQSMDINYDDGDVELRVRQTWVRCGLSIGDLCEGNFHGRGMWYPGNVHAVHDNGSMDLVFDDGDHEENVPPNQVRRRLPTTQEMASSAERDAENQNIWCHECQSVVGNAAGTDGGELQCPRCNGFFVEIVDDVQDHPQNFAAATQVETERRSRQQAEASARQSAIIQQLFSSLGGLMGGGAQQASQQTVGSGASGSSGDGGNGSSTSSPSLPSSDESGQGQATGQGGNHPNPMPGTAVSFGSGGRVGVGVGGGGGGGGGGGALPEGGIAAAISQVIGSITQAIPQQSDGNGIQFHVVHGGLDGIGGLSGLGVGAQGGSPDIMQNLTQFLGNMLGGQGAGGLASNPGDYVNSTEALESLMTQLLQASGGSSGAPPAEQSVMESLAAVEVTDANINDLDCDCAVCKDGFEKGETFHHLPCNHFFHCACIRPWLDMVSIDTTVYFFLRVLCITCNLEYFFLCSFFHRC